MYIIDGIYIIAWIMILNYSEARNEQTNINVYIIWRISQNLFKILSLHFGWKLTEYHEFYISKDNLVHMPQREIFWILNTQTHVQKTV